MKFFKKNNKVDVYLGLDYRNSTLNNQVLDSSIGSCS